MSITRDIRIALGGTYGALTRLIIVNVVVFLLLNIIVSIMMMSGNPDAGETIRVYTDLPAQLRELLPHCWTIVTYMFVHYSFLHLLSNMLWLYFLGRVFSDLLGGARLTGVYLVGGLIGGIFFVALSNVIPHEKNSILEGASGGVMAVVVAAASYRPDLTLFFFRWPVKLKWIALISFLLTTVLDLSANTGGKLAHIGGALFGFIYGTQLRTGKNFLGKFMSLFRLKKSPLRVEHRRSQRSSDTIYNQNKASIRRQVDEILDKISRSGYDSLTKEEKKFLQEHHDKF